MARRGHDVRVVTYAPRRTSGGVHQHAEQETVETGVASVLSNIQWGPPYPPESMVGLLRSEAADRAAIQNTLNNFRPEAIDIWGMEFAPQPLPLVLAAGPVPVHFTIEDVWLCSTWRNDPLLIVGQLARDLDVPTPPGVAALLGPGLHMPDVAGAGVTFVSNALGRHYAESGFRHPAPRVRMAGIDVSRFAAAEPASPPPFVILNVGRLTEGRGQADLVAAALRLVTASTGLPRLVLRLVGEADPAFAARLRSLARDVPGLELEIRGAVPPDEIAESYGGAHLFVHASRLPEGLPIVLMEAMAAGLPVIATDSGGQRDILDEGKWGRLIPAGSPDAMADAIGDAIQHYDSWRRRAAAAREHALHAFNIETYVDGHIEDLREAAARSGGSGEEAQVAAQPDDADLRRFRADLSAAARTGAAAFDVDADPDGTWRLAIVLKRCGALAEARELFERLGRTASRRNADRRRSAFHLGEIAMIEARWDEAAAHLQTCLDVAPDHRKALYDLEHVRQRRRPDHLQGLES
jgi:glycosyltransferase involved in cell wall biosynthesis